MATQFGTTLAIGVTTLVGYIVVSKVDGKKNTDQEDVVDEAGVTKTRVIYQQHPKLSYELIALSGTAPATDFPEGLKCVVAGLTDYIVESCSITTSKGPTKVSVELVNIGV